MIKYQLLFLSYIFYTAEIYKLYKNQMKITTATEAMWALTHTHTHIYTLKYKVCLK